MEYLANIKNVTWMLKEQYEAGETQSMANLALQICHLLCNTKINMACSVAFGCNKYTIDPNLAGRTVFLDIFE